MGTLALAALVGRGVSGGPPKSTNLSLVWLIGPEIGWNGFNLTGYQGCVGLCGS
jgi:hypothetical protein